MSTVLVDIPASVARITLNRPEMHNALDEALIADLTQAFQRMGADPEVRVVVLSGAGKSFCAGGDLNWMQRAAAQSEAENRADAQRLSDLFAAVNFCPKPVIGVVQGSAMGGGMGLAACCDMVMAAEDARFGLTEVRLGLIPATIAPFVVAKIGASRARRYMLTGERFDAAEALRIGLVHAIGTDVQPWIDALLSGGPEAIADTKALIADVAGQPISDDLRAMTADRIAMRRATDEAREGMAAFLGKRKPGWSGDV